MLNCYKYTTVLDYKIGCTAKIFAHFWKLPVSVYRLNICLHIYFLQHLPLPQPKPPAREYPLSGEKNSEQWSHIFFFSNQAKRIRKITTIIGITSHGEIPSKSGSVSFPKSPHLRTVSFIKE